MRKLDQGQKLGKDEYQRLMEYIEELRDKSPESYMLFMNAMPSCFIRTTPHIYRALPRELTIYLTYLWKSLNYCPN